MIEKKILKGFIAKKLSIVPLRKDKVPNTSGWKKYQSTFINVEENAHLFEAVGLVCGEVSGNVEVIDVDQKNEIWKEGEKHLVDKLIDKIELFSPGLYSKLTVAETVNGGYHFIYKCEKIGGNVKLASRQATEKEKKKGETKVVLLETRGSGGYIVSVPTEGYNIKQGELSNIPTITPQERDIIFSCCRMLDEEMPPVFMENPNIPWASEGLTPWDDYNDRGNWQSVLQSAGWTIKTQKGVRIPVCRPDRKTPSGNFNTQYNLLRVFSSSTIFDTDKSYNPFSIYAMIVCGGDHKMAARELKEMGYGRTPESKFKIPDEPADIDNSHEYLADKSEEEMIYSFAKGDLELGLTTGYPALDPYFKFKRNQFNIVGGLPNIGKSTLMWLLQLIARVLHGWKTVFFCPENEMWEVKMEMIQLLMGKTIKEVYDQDGKIAIDKCLKFLNSEFKFIELDDDLSYKDLLDICDDILSKEKIDTFIIDPYNAVTKMDFSEIDRKLSSHEYHYAVADKFKKWSKSRKVTLFVNMHPAKDGMRNVHQSGDFKGHSAPIKASGLEGAGKWWAKVDDMLLPHRYTKHEEMKNVTLVHVDKIKKKYSGGDQTPVDSPVKLIYKRYKNFLGFWDENDVNPLYNWAKVNILGQEIPEEPIEPNISEHVYDTFEENEEQQAVHNYNQGNTLRGSRPSIEEEEDDTPY